MLPGDRCHSLAAVRDDIDMVTELADKAPQGVLVQRVVLGDQHLQNAWRDLGMRLWGNLLVRPHLGHDVMQLVRWHRFDECRLHHAAVGGAGLLRARGRRGDEDYRQLGRRSQRPQRNR